jgi:nitronate monooxygenase
METALKPLRIKDKTIPVPIIQGGMGVGVSMHPLAAAVAKEGGIGIVSSACIDRLVSKRNGKRIGTYDAVYEEISLAKASGGFVGINIMVALIKSYPDSVRASIDAGADFIISGAGLPLSLPSIQPSNHTALIPIVSSVRALTLICRKWEKLGHRPDAVVLEGPLAGGHLGFKPTELELEANRLENLLPPVKDVAIKHGDIPVIVAGGIYTHEDILKFQSMGADAVQMGTRFLATEESSATDMYKQAVVNATDDNIIIAEAPGSPCGLPFRAIRQSPMIASSAERMPKCNKGYLLLRDDAGNFTRCSAKEDNKVSFCICNGLLSSAGYNSDKEPPVYTVGTNASRVNKVVSVKNLMEELAGKVLASQP